jgi:hypothetical protein
MTVLERENIESARVEFNFSDKSEFQKDLMDSILSVKLSSLAGAKRDSMTDVRFIDFVESIPLVSFQGETVQMNIGKKGIRVSIRKKESESIEKKEPLTFSKENLSKLSNDVNLLLGIFMSSPSMRSKKFESRCEASIEAKNITKNPIILTFKENCFESLEELGKEIDITGSVIEFRDAATNDHVSIDFAYDKKENKLKMDVESKAERELKVIDLNEIVDHVMQTANTMFVKLSSFR